MWSGPLSYALALPFKSKTFWPTSGVVICDPQNIAYSGGPRFSRRYVWKWVPFYRAIAIMIDRAATGQTCSYSYPVVETTHKDNISLRIRPAPESKSRRSTGPVKPLDGACVLRGNVSSGGGRVSRHPILELTRHTNLPSSGRILVNETAP